MRARASYIRTPCPSDVRRTSTAQVLRAVPSRALLPGKDGVCSPRPYHCMQVSPCAHSVSLQDLCSASMSATAVRSPGLYAHGVRVSSRLRASSLVDSNKTGNVVVRGGI
jgi:hypothetical protein